MHRFLIIVLLTVYTTMLHAQSKIELTVGSKSVTATLVDNAATRELISILGNNPITIEMSDYGGFEKVGELPTTLPVSNSQITTEAGDIMLYQGNNMVIFYGSNRWSYTRLGKIDGATAENLKEFLGSGNISLKISLKDSGIENMSEERIGKERVYDLKGHLITKRPLSSGIYIINGKKILIER